MTKRMIRNCYKLSGIIDAWKRMINVFKQPIIQSSTPHVRAPCPIEELNCPWEAEEVTDCGALQGRAWPRTEWKGRVTHGGRPVEQLWVPGPEAELMPNRTLLQSKSKAQFLSTGLQGTVLTLGEKGVL